MYDTPTVSVVIPAFNRGRLLVRAIQSALHQTVVPTEVIVVDDGSVEDIAALVRQSVNDARVSILRQSNSGPAKARNRGIRAAIGDFVAFLDSDDVWLPDKLEKQITALERSPESLIATCGAEWIDENGNVLSTRLHSNEFPRVWQLMSIAMPTVVVRRIALNEGFWENYTYLEDKDLYLRLGLVGGVVTINEVLVQISRSQVSMTSELAYDPQRLMKYDRDVELFWQRCQQFPGIDRTDVRHLRRKVAVLRHDIGEFGLKMGLNTIARRNLLWAWRMNPKRLETLKLLAKSCNPFRSNGSRKGAGA